MTKIKKLALVTVAALGLGLGASHIAIPQTAGQFLTSLISTDAIQVYRSGTAAITYVTPTVLSNYVRGTSLLYTVTATAATTATTIEQTLATYSLAANTLNVGTKLRIGASFSTGANTNTKTYKCYFGTAVITSTALATNNKNGSCEMIVTKIASNQQTVYANMLVDTTPITGYVNFPVNTDTSAIVIKFTGSNGSPVAADIVMNDFWVERIGN